MTGHAQNATTQTLHDEQCVTGAKNHVLLEVEVASVETIATSTTGEATTEEEMTNEGDNANSVAPSTITIGHAQNATTPISHSETYVTDAMNLALAVEVVVAVDREITTDKVAGATISAPPMVATDDKADETTEDIETTGTGATDGKADETTEDIETTGTATTDGKADETTGDSETTGTATTDGKADETTEDSAAVVVNVTAVAKATTAQPAEVGNEMDDLSEVLQTTTFAEPRGSDRAMPTTDHPVISELRAGLNEKTSEWMWPRERRITLPQRP